MDEHDARLIAEVIEGNEDAFSALFEKYRTLVYCQAYRLVLDSEDALDIVQDTFIKLIGVIEQKGLNIQNLPAFLRRMALNEALDFLRARRRKAVFNRMLFRDQACRAAPALQGEHAARRELHDALIQAVLRLSPLQQRVVCLRHFEDLRIAEIAEICGCSVGAVKQHLHRAYQKLRRIVNRDAFSEFPGIESNGKMPHAARLQKDWD
ncbi:MAG: RNA polymerase sigma factor [Candidatus Sumerlaeia bacterium]